MVTLLDPQGRRWGVPRMAAPKFLKKRGWRLLGPNGRVLPRLKPSVSRRYGTRELTGRSSDPSGKHVQVPSREELEVLELVHSVLHPLASMLRSRRFQKELAARVFHPR